MEERGEEERLACVQEEIDAAASFSSGFKRRRSREDSLECAKFGDYLIENIKHGRQENAISSAFEFEIQHQIEELQNSDVTKKTTCRAKRTKCVYLPRNAYDSVNSGHHPISSDIQSFPSTQDKVSLKAAMPISSKSTNCDSSSAPHFGDSDSGVSKPSGASKQCFIQDQNDLNRAETAKEKMGESLDFDAKELPKSTFFDRRQEAICNLDPLHTNQKAIWEATIVDVHITIQASNRVENVPFVCLTSKLTGKAILGYPLEIGVLCDPFETILLRNKNGEGSKFHRLVWRTSRRTPVCYVTNSRSSSISKNSQGRKESDAVQDPIPIAKEDSSLTKFRKRASEGANRGAASRACVPVELVFSKVLAALGQVRS